ncbi:MAG: prepilin-type N-terminal cleavage/methylation domain-containing protein, partial [Thermodesulfobacteriota bacterium]
MKFFVTKKRGRGFTVIEVVTTMAIAAILLGIGVPSIVSYMPRLRLNGASRQLMFDMVEARMQAVKNACDVTVSFRRDGSYTI